MIDDFHARGVKVLFPYNPWDQVFHSLYHFILKGTRDSGIPDAQHLNQLWEKIGADGFNGDTCTGLSSEFFQVPFHVIFNTLKTQYPLGIEPEVGVDTVQELQWNTMSWGYWEYPTIPMVSTYKW